MKLSFKLSSLAMVACASLYALSILIFEIPRIASWTIGKIDIYYLPHVAVLIGMIIFGIGLYQHQEQIPRLNKSLRWQAIGIMIMTLCALLYHCFTNGFVRIYGMAYCYWNPWFHFIIVLWVVAWLLQFILTRHKNTYLNPALGVAGIIVAVAAALLLTFMFVSYVHVLMTGYVAGFQTTAWLSWLRPIALMAIGGSMLLGDCSVIKAKEPTDSKNQELRSYSRTNQIIAKVSVGAVLTFIILGIIGGIFSWFSHNYFMVIYTITTFALLHMLWISSVIAMLLEKDLVRWHRTLNILAPIVINGVLVLWVLVAAYIPNHIEYRLGRIITDDIPIIGIILSLIFVVAVWIINTIVVLRTTVRTKEKSRLSIL